MPPSRAYVPADLQSLLLAAALPALELTFRPMFGGIMGYARGRPFASLSNVGLGLKLGGADDAELLALPGARRLQYEPASPPSKTYIVLPNIVLDHPDQLAAWISRSAKLQFAEQPAKKPRKAKPALRD